MPVETIKCRECGSADVTEFKSGSYVCAHCEAVFKHVNPNRVTVQQEFCECGQRVTLRCVACDAGLCENHRGGGARDLLRRDWIHAVRRKPLLTSSGLAETSLLWIPTRLPAYRLWLKDRTDLRAGYFIPADASATRLEDDYVAGLQKDVTCQACYERRYADSIADFAEKLPDIGDRLAAPVIAGEQCAEAGCKNPAHETCSCCGYRWCSGGHETGMSPFHLFVDGDAYTDFMRRWTESSRPPLHQHSQLHDMMVMMGRVGAPLRCERCWGELGPACDAIVDKNGGWEPDMTTVLDPLYDRSRRERKSVQPVFDRICNEIMLYLGEPEKCRTMTADGFPTYGAMIVWRL